MARGSPCCIEFALGIPGPTELPNLKRRMILRRKANNGMEPGLVTQEHVVSLVQVTMVRNQNICCNQTIFRTGGGSSTWSFLLPSSADNMHLSIRGPLRHLSIREGARQDAMVKISPPDFSPQTI